MQYKVNMHCAHHNLYQIFNFTSVLKCLPQEKVKKIEKIKDFFNLLDSQINMLMNTKAKATSITKVPFEKFIFLHLQTTLQKLHRLVTSDSDIACNLLISSNPKGTNSVAFCQNQEEEKHYLPIKSEKQQKISNIQNHYYKLVVKQVVLFKIIQTEQCTMLSVF